MGYLFTRINGDRVHVKNNKEVELVLSEDYVISNLPLHRFLRKSTVENLLQNFGINPLQFRVGYSVVESDVGSLSIAPKLICDKDSNITESYAPLVILTNVETAEDGGLMAERLNTVFETETTPIDLSLYRSYTEVLKVVVESINRSKITHFYVFDESLLNILTDFLENNLLPNYQSYTLQTYNFDEAIEGFAVTTTSYGTVATNGNSASKKVTESFLPYEE